ncbi:hypothetical protein NIES2119_31645 [[Phormidium ambiguum] IAM M-71]|uniref:Uncharacterized protein n=1 Tax=[Phormidium ambiguum] IAM M-71 TaxID=454136 RepID=A0A1U7I1Y6_9CYAN|nr:hypothetical protein [Phormidium ambiguum]OKH30031.1 hypothetical protein NIES2119_31645 [Phormidium ambiguum IAM M-71]
MTNSNENSIDQRLTEVEGQITDIRSRMQTDSQLFGSLQLTVAELADIARLHQQALRVIQRDAEADRAQMREMQAEIREILIDIRGIQTENQRILNHLFGQQN